MTAAIVRITPLKIADGPWETIPGSTKANGWRVDGAKVGDENGNYRVVEVVYEGDQPTPFHAVDSESLSLSGNTLTITRVWAAPALGILKSLLRNKLEDDAGAVWLAARGVTSAQIESALTDGKAAITSSGSTEAAIAAYDAVVWP